MTILETMARNLRILCEERGSIAKVCRKIGINRQQFNKYLAGQCMPNKSSLYKICSYFEIDETELVTTESWGLPTDKLEVSKLLTIPGSRQILENITHDPPTSLHPGMYFIHYVLKDVEPLSLMRVLVVLRNENGMLTFRRFTNYSEPSDSAWHYVRGDHVGIVVERAHWFYFAGVSYMGIGEPTLITVQWLPIAAQILSGTALVGDDSGPKSFPVIMEQIVRPTTLRQGLKQSKILPVSSDEISTHLRNVVHHKIQTGR